MNKLYKDYPSEYRSWAGAKTRCFNPNNTGFAQYGGFGITMCTEWRISFSAFLKDMGPKPQKGWHIHRINNEGDYEPNNCIWIEPKIHRHIPHRPPIHSIKGLTEKQAKILDFIASQQLSPSMREIGDFFGMSVKGAYDHVKALERKGKITMQSNKARSIIVL